MKKEKSVKQTDRKAIYERLKSLIFPVILSAVIVAGIIFILNYKGAEEPEEIIQTRGYDGGDQEIVLENDSLKLVMVFGIYS